MFLRFILHSLLDFLFYALLTVGLFIFILPYICYLCFLDLWPLKRSLSSTSSPRAIYTWRIQIILLLAPLSHNYLNIIRTKWSFSFILFVPFSRCSWICPFNHSWYLICKPYCYCLCKKLQQYFHCEWTISSIPKTTTAYQLSAVLRDSRSARFCFPMSRHDLITLPSIIFTHPISSCAIAAPMNLSGIISSFWSCTCSFPNECG